jgi:hypothetical protein
LKAHDYKGIAQILKYQIKTNENIETGSQLGLSQYLKSLKKYSEQKKDFANKNYLSI